MPPEHNLRKRLQRKYLRTNRIDRNEQLNEPEERCFEDQG
jgi:hypothetical protein